ncbi:Serine/threonine protein phosphatase [Hahella chejuensis KCTC 2396]|uniref:Serine/threonine protein phosphatase n=1 Tax=Hahella chejuensis (strain KCTC 2396) TaxID=349521 RepID=Q2SIF8_HAHCH|nr:protein phosphatase 2C domain-containing protein [Hahella chejuensis]ABC29566.1 Serine/threonine protein phosphatase [Hahella chejuensis KCTC 2396]
MKLKVTFQTNTGLQREHNEDTVLICGQVINQSMPEPVTRYFETAGSESWAVSDGLGGHACGALASYTLCSTLAACNLSVAPDLQSVLDRCQSRLAELMHNRPETHGLGATLAGVYEQEGALHAFNIGDSRIYHWQFGYLRQVSIDDVFGYDDDDPPELTGLDGHKLIAALGVEPINNAPYAHYRPIRFGVTDRLLICTDGVTDIVSASEFEANMMSGATEQVGEWLSARIRAGGAHDNFSFILIERLDD